MDEIVGSIKRVTEIMTGITAASHEQSTGIDQINQAVSQMDEGTQQNAALVEEAAAAAAASLEEQAHGLVGAISIFNVGQDTQKNAIVVQFNDIKSEKRSKLTQDHKIIRPGSENRAVGSGTK